MFELWVPRHLWVPDAEEAAAADAEGGGAEGGGAEGAAPVLRALREAGLRGALRLRSLPPALLRFGAAAAYLVAGAGVGAGAGAGAGAGDAGGSGGAAADAPRRFTIVVPARSLVLGCESLNAFARMLALRQGTPRPSSSLPAVASSSLPPPAAAAAVVVVHDAPSSAVLFYESAGYARALRKLAAGGGAVADDVGGAAAAAPGLAALFSDDEAARGAVDPAAFLSALVRRLFGAAGAPSGDQARAFRRQLSEGDLVLLDGGGPTCAAAASTVVDEAALLPALTECRRARFARMAEHPTWTTLLPLARAAARAAAAAGD